MNRSGSSARGDPSFTPDTVLGVVDIDQPQLPLSSDGVQRWVWSGKFGAMLIEVIGRDVFVNGQRVEPHVS